MKAPGKTSAFEVSGSSGPERGQMLSFRLKSVERLARDPVSLAKSLADVADRTGCEIKRVGGLIENTVNAAMYDSMRGSFASDTLLTEVVQDKGRNVISGNVIGADEVQMRHIVHELALTYSPRSVQASVKNVRDAASTYHSKLQAFQDAILGNTEAMRDEDRCSGNLGKVGNAVNLDMANLGRVPENIRELLLMQRRALHAIGVTSLNIIVQHVTKSTDGKPIDHLSAMSVVMESHLATLIRRDIKAAFLSYFTCGDAKHPLPAAKLFHDALRPEHAMLQMWHPGSEKGKVQQVPIYGDFDSALRPGGRGKKKSA